MDACRALVHKVLTAGLGGHPILALAKPLGDVVGDADDLLLSLLQGFGCLWAGGGLVTHGISRLIQMV